MDPVGCSEPAKGPSYGKKPKHVTGSKMKEQNPNKGFAECLQRLIKSTPSTVRYNFITFGN